MFRRQRPTRAMGKTCKLTIYKGKVMIKNKTTCICFQCDKIITHGEFKSKINGLVVCGDCKLLSRPTPTWTYQGCKRFDAN